MKVGDRVRVIVKSGTFYGHEGVITDVWTLRSVSIVFDDYVPKDPRLEPKSKFAFRTNELELI